jgi:UDP-2-acetamido-3-amino-2,3-dideoxy-glucuronate N-acetyltransferase
MTMKKDIGVAVIGTGYWGRNLVRNYHNLGYLTAICDADNENLAKIVAQYPDLAAHRCLEDVLADAKVDAVAIATPAATHADIVGLALDAGKHVFVEKPLCLNVDEAEALADRADSLGRVLMVGHLLLYHPAFIALKAALDGGRIGNLRYIYSNRLSLGKIRREENALWSFAPHDISMILSLIGASPHRVVATGGSYLHSGVADTTLSHLSFFGQLQAHIFVSWLHPYKDQKLVVVGDEAMAVFDDVYMGDEKLLLYPHDVGWDGELPVVTKANAQPIAYDDVEPLRMECQAFIDAVVEAVRPPSDSREGIRVLRVLNACQDSLLSGGPVRLD